MAPLYGQVVVGPPGAGKTTYCNGMQQYLRLLGRDAWVLNFDPANEGINDSAGEAGESETGDLRYETIYDVCTEAVDLTSVMEKMGLGPNGGLVYCMEYVESHVDDVIAKLRKRLAERSYVLLDFPGQVELYTHSSCVQSLLGRLSKALDLRLTAVQLVDAHYCTDPTKFIAAALLGTTTMVRLELPTVSVLSKVDLLSRYGELPFDFEYFTECHELDRLLPFLEASQSSIENERLGDGGYEEDPDYQTARRRRLGSKFSQKYERLHRAIAEVVDDFSLLSFVPLDISSAESVGRVLARIDKSNGYSFTEASVSEDMFQCAIQSDLGYESIADVRERVSTSNELQGSGGEQEEHVVSRSWKP